MSAAPVTVRRHDAGLGPDPHRVVATLFLPGQEGPGASRAEGVVRRCLDLDEGSVRDLLAQVHRSFGTRHDDLVQVFEENFAAVAHRVPHAATLSPGRRRLVGAYFTQEVAIGAAAVCNPSMVAHPVQDGPAGSLRFVLSARAIGEGHVSSVVLRGGLLGPGPAATADLVLDDRPTRAVAGRRRPATVDRDRLARSAVVAGADPDTLAFVLGRLPGTLEAGDLEAALARLRQQRLTRVHAVQTARVLRDLVDDWYEVGFSPATPLAARVVRPSAPQESKGMEDARFVRFTDDDGTVTYLATYTAFDGHRVSCRRLATDDFVTFRSSPLTGRGAQDKGMALFPRPVGGHHLALSRWDRENVTLARSDDGHHWTGTTVLQAPAEPWEFIQLGNCGSPVETPAGWLVLTHGVGPVRTYTMGALLLDLDDPTQVVGRLRRPLLEPADDERDGYVPNVVYSCGALLHGTTLVVPYGCSDARIRFAMLDLDELLGAFTG